MTNHFDFTLSALVGLRTAQQQIEAAQDRIMVAKRDRDIEARNQAEQDLFDWRKILIGAEQVADYAIERASKQAAA